RASTCPALGSCATCRPPSAGRWNSAVAPRVAARTGRLWDDVRKDHDRLAPAPRVPRRLPMAEVRTANVVWTGDLVNGSGMITYVTSGVFSRLPISWEEGTSH